MYRGSLQKNHVLLFWPRLRSLKNNKYFYAMKKKLQLFEQLINFVVTN